MRCTLFFVLIKKFGRQKYRVTYFNTPEQAQNYFDSKKKEFKAAAEAAAITENGIIADTLTYYEDEYVEISFEDAFFPA